MLRIGAQKDVEGSVIETDLADILKAIHEAIAIIVGYIRNSFREVKIIGLANTRKNFPLYTGK